MFNFFKDKFFSFCNTFSQKVLSVFSSNSITNEELEQFFELLVTFDVGVKLSREIVNKLKNEISSGKIKESQQVLQFVQEYLLEILTPLPKVNHTPEVIILLGINGAGKTTTAAKLAQKMAAGGKQVLLVAADTFRAAAVQQLESWAKLTEVELFVGKENADPSSVIFDAGKYAETKHFDHVIIDTAGRLHTNLNLIKELEKTSKVTKKIFANKSIASWIVVDSMLGQNSFEQVKTFGNAVPLDGVILTKMDCSSKGGVIFAIAKTFNLNIAYLTVAENDLSGIKEFDAKEFTESLFS